MASDRAGQTRKETITHKERNKKYVEEYKRTHPCEVCGEDHIACLDFHHRDKSEKRQTISTLVTRGATMNQLVAEVKKCVVLCCNCHRRIHWEEEH